MGNDFRITRVIKRVTQEYLETKTGINQTRISLIENGVAEPTQKEKKKLSKALGVDLGDIWPQISGPRGRTLLTRGMKDDG